MTDLWINKGEGYLHPMRGTIVDINIARGMVAVQINSGSFSIFEMLSDVNFKVGDEVQWEEDKPLGDCRIKNITESESGDVYFQNHDVSLSNLRNQLRY